MTQVNQIDQVSNYQRESRLVRIAMRTYDKLKVISKIEGLPMKTILDLMIEVGDLDQIKSFGDYLADKHIRKD